MAVSAAKENILRRIRQALSNPAPIPFPQSEGNSSLFLPHAEGLDILFAEEFIQLQGKFAYCTDEADMTRQVGLLIAEKQWNKIYCLENKWKDVFGNTTDLAGCDASITGCEILVARTGTLVMSAAEQSGRTVSVYAPVHICIAYSRQLVFDIKDALQQLKEKYAGNLPSLITFASGPSRTADIEKTLVTGVHGPKEVFLFLIDG
jgi:L-lactate dehydrogenase complex protein LldG